LGDYGILFAVRRALTISLVFFAGAIMLKNRLKVQFSITLLISGITSIFLALYLVFTILMGIGNVVKEGVVLLFFGAIIMGLIGILLLSDYIKKIENRLFSKLPQKDSSISSHP